ncbi:MAG TPA: thioesterase family protein [Ktedonobacteraceae bacterium]|jgi:acyl-CoA thioester hydrolase|nr:thioesterase family protein [Ktedonobacteraceae bacterium]
MPQTSIAIRVPFSDVDSTGRIHFTAMFRYMEIAEHELRRSIGFPQATSFPHIAFPRVHASCDFRGAVRYDDQIVVEARVDRVGHSSWTVTFTARLKGEERNQEQERRGPVVAEGKMTMVAMDTTTEQAVSLPDELRAALTDD